MAGASERGAVKPLGWATGHRPVRRSARLGAGCLALRTVGKAGLAVGHGPTVMGGGPWALPPMSLPSLGPPPDAMAMRCSGSQGRRWPQRWMRGPPHGRGEPGSPLGSGLLGADGCSWDGLPATLRSSPKRAGDAFVGGGDNGSWTPPRLRSEAAAQCKNAVGSVVAGPAFPFFVAQRPTNSEHAPRAPARRVPGANPGDTATEPWSCLASGT